MRSVRETFHVPRRTNVEYRGFCCVLRSTTFPRLRYFNCGFVHDSKIITLFSQPNLQMTEKPLTTLWQLAKSVLPPTLVFMARDASALLRYLVFFMQERTDVAKTGCQFIYIISVTFSLLEKCYKSTTTHA